VEIRERRIHTVTVLEPLGRLVLTESPSDNVLKDRIESLLSEGRQQFVIDLGQLSHVDTSGLTTLVHVCLAVRKQRGRITLSNPTKRMRELLSVTKLNAFLEVFDNERDAIESLAKESI